MFHMRRMMHWNRHRCVAAETTRPHYALIVTVDPQSPNGPHAPTIEAHTHHKVDSAGSECIAVPHAERSLRTIGDINVRSHTFRFVTPAKTDAMGIPNACNTCHTDKSTQWTAQALDRWADSARLGHTKD